MKWRYLILLTLLFGFKTNGLWAQTPVVYELGLKGSAGKLAKDSSVTVTDSLYADANYSAKRQAYSSRNRVILRIDPVVYKALPASFTATVQVKIDYTTPSGNSSTTRNLTLRYRADSTYTNSFIYQFQGGTSVTVKVLDRTTDASAGIWSSLELVNQLEALPVYSFDCSNDVLTTIGFESLAMNTSNDAIRASWPLKIGADAYDVEWTYIDSAAMATGYYGTIGSPLPARIFDNNSSRVTITGNSYMVPLLYDGRGHLFVRARPVQILADGSRKEAQWGTATARFEFAGHENSLNWQATTSFAEEGKRKSVLDYFDGSLRSRQTVTKDNETQNTIVAESIYDFQGRPVIQVLPAPTLNTTIGYTRAFNQGLNSASYDAGNFDALGGVSDCARTADSMLTGSGAAKYYSPLNPLKDQGFNQFIPDAKGYPFTQVEYTADQTGRISAQSGVGKDFQLKSGHETKYYYVGAGQEELNALFGTEVGLARHYFKTMVRDANGQYSISYTDMAGKTIATALSGSLPYGSGLDTLQSSNKRMLTEKMSDAQSTVIKDLAMETQRGLVVSMAGTYSFQYSLNPEVLSLANCASTPVCYDCLYDLQISVQGSCTDPAGEAFAFDTTYRNFTIGQYDTACNTVNNGFNISFSKYLQPGSYQITKRLSVNRQALAYYRDTVYVRNNTCTTVEQLTTQQLAVLANISSCQATCKACTDSLGTFAQFWANYRSKAGVTTAEDSTALYPYAITAYSEAKNNCDELCNGSVDSADIRRSMLLDMTPSSGQYANLDNIIDNKNIFFSHYFETGGTDTVAAYTKITDYKDVAGNPAMVYDDRAGQLVSPAQLSPEMFASKFQFSWAEALLPLHPEYKKLQAYQALAASHEWDVRVGKVDSYSEALTKGYLNPLGTSGTNYTRFNGTAGSIDRDPLATLNSGFYANNLKNGLEKYAQVGSPATDMNLWSMATIMVKCTGANKTSACYVSYQNMPASFPASGTCADDLDAAWKIFRQLYLQIKRKLIFQQLATISGVPTPIALKNLGYSSNFGDASEMMAAAGQTIPNDQASAGAYAASNANTLKSFYASNCQAYAAQWMEQLKGCNYSQADYDIVIPRLVSVCQAGADVQHPLGASTVRPDTITTYRSFEQVLRAYNKEKGYPETSDCHPFLITTPGPWEAPQILANTVVAATPDTCSCNKINSYYASFVADPKGATTFSQYLLSVYQTSIADSTLTRLRTACTANGTGCSSFSTPITLPPLFQCNVGSVCIDCDRMASLNKEFSSLYPDRKPVADSLATSVSQQAANSLYTQFMNYRLGFTKSVTEYLSFVSSCNISLSNICADNSKLVDTFLMQRLPASWTQFTAEGQALTDRNTFFTNGVLRLPDSIRAKGGAWYNSASLSFGGWLCRGPSYTNELRLRYNSDQQLGGDIMYLGDQHHSYLFDRYADSFRVGTTMYPPGIYLISVQNVKTSPTVTYFLNEFVQLSNDPDFFRSWRVLKFRVAPDTIAIYADDVLRIKVPRDNSSIDGDLNNTFGYRGRYWETDYVKYYNSQNALVYFEDFVDPGRPATPRLELSCDNIVSSCESYFATWFNQRKGTNYTYAQIDSLFRSTCGYSPTICRASSPFDQNSLASAVDSFVLRTNTVTWTQSTAEGQNLTDRNIFFINGLARLPDSIRAKGGSWYNGVGVNFTGNICSPGKFTLELKNRYTGPSLSGDIWYMSDGNQSYLFDRYLSSVTVGGRQYAPGVYLTQVAKQSTYFLKDTCVLISADTGWIGNWHQLKFTYTADSIWMYADNVLKGRIARDHSALQPISGVGFGYRGRYWETDYVNAYDANNTLVYNEDFNDPGRPAQVKPYALCTNNSANCQSSFTTYFNQQRGTNYTYTQIDSIYRKVLGYSPPVCTLPATGYPPAAATSDTLKTYPSIYLCGRSTSIFSDVKMTDSISNCSDNNFFAFSKATEIFQHRRDSLNTVFDSLYRQKCLNAYRLENFTVTHEVREYHFTLYYYDQAGNLVKTVPPEGVQARFAKSFTDSVDLARSNGTVLTPAHTLATQYRYNALNQVVAQWTPDAGRSRFWYDRLGRLVASQNNKQYYASATEAGRKYSYTQYDALGRITEVGETSNAGSTAVSQSLTRNATNWAGWLSAATANRADITQTVYDAAYAGFTAGEQPLVQRNLRNRVSYTTITAGSNPAQFNAASFYSYDIHGNVDTLVQDYGSSTTGVANLMNSNANRWKKLVYQYDLISGKVNQVNYNAGKADQFFHRYRYDGENRLQSVQTSSDGQQWEEDARYQYYLHGPLARTVLGQDQVQGLDYAYTLQGWLKGVNSTTQREGLYDMGRDGQLNQPTQYVGRDAAGFQLTYYATDYQPIASGVTPFPNYNWLLPAGEFRALYNGNISGMAVNIGALNAPLLYNYRYDQLNRLTGMDAYTGLNQTNNSWGTMSNSGAYKERLRYDGNGNILNVQRQGMAGNLSMDSLQYNYPRNGAGQLTSNRLQWVRDAISNTAYADDIDNQSAGNYGYDSIGNLTRDDQAGITGIEWTVYGKIRKITKASGQTISYGYDAAGNRISKTVTTNGQTTYTWYVRDAQGNTLSTYSSSGSGSTIPSTITQTDVHLYGSSRIGVMNRGIDAKQSLTTPDTTTIQRGWKFFELSNHLGNVLATVTDKKLGHTPDGINVDYYNADVVTVSDYYPFGMLMPGRQQGQGVNIPGVSSTGTTQVNGYSVPADMTVASRSGSEPSSYVAANSVEFTGSFESLAADEMEAYIADGSYAGTGNVMGGVSGGAGKYRYGFNGQEMSNEIKGVGNSYTAEFWEYDPRIGRRWNVDPVIDPSESPYATNKNNPILFDDPEGDCPTCPKPKEDGKAEGDLSTTSTRVFGARNSTVDTENWHWHAGSTDYNTKAGWYNNEDYQKVLSGPAKDAAGFLGMYSNAVGYNGNWSDEQKANVSDTRLGRFLSDKNSDGFNFQFGRATTNAANERNFSVTGTTMPSGFNVEDMVGLGLLGKGLVQMAGRKIIGSAQTTGTLGHAFTSNVIAWRYALDPRVSRVSLDLGYKKLLGLQTAPFKWGPRPDIGVFFRNGRVKVFEVVSRTDVERNLINRNADFMRRWSIGGETPITVKPFSLRSLYK